MTSKGIQLPAFDLEMLCQGRLIAVPFKQHLREGEALLLYPTSQLPGGMKLEEYYQAQYAELATNLRQGIAHGFVTIQAWGEVVGHWRINPEARHLLPKIAKANIWNLNALDSLFGTHKAIKFVILRVYSLSKPLPVQAVPYKPFYFTQPEDDFCLNKVDNSPIFTDFGFAERKENLLAGKENHNQALEDIYVQLNKLESDYGQELKNCFCQFLGYQINQPETKKKSDLDWINTITALGNRSKEKDTKKSNYQAGTEFENIVQKSLEFLGFTIDYAHKGGAGGLDLFCSQPYPLVGECKAGKKIPNDTAVQLLNLGTLRLPNSETLKQATKIIIGPGKPTSQLQEAAQKHNMAIINPETLEKLVKLQDKYPNSVDLWELRDYLKPGLSNEQIIEYISQVEKKIELRSHLLGIIIKLKEQAAKTENYTLTVPSIHGAYSVSQPPQQLSQQAIHEILLELASPLVGCLGRKPQRNWQQDEFYFLRNLPHLNS